MSIMSQLLITMIMLVNWIIFFSVGILAKDGLRYLDNNNEMISSFQKQLESLEEEITNINGEHVVSPKNECYSKFSRIIHGHPTEIQDKIVNEFFYNSNNRRCCDIDSLKLVLANALNNLLHEFAQILTINSINAKSSLSCFKSIDLVKVNLGLDVASNATDDSSMFISNIVKNINSMNNKLSKCMKAVSNVYLGNILTLCFPQEIIDKLIIKKNDEYVGLKVSKKQIAMLYEECHEYVQESSNLSGLVANSFIDITNYLMGIEKCYYFSNFFTYDQAIDADDPYYPDEVKNRSEPTYMELLEQWHKCTLDTLAVMSYSDSNELLAKIKNSLQQYPEGLSNDLGRNEVDFSVIQKHFYVERFKGKAFHVKCSKKTCIANCPECQDIQWNPNAIVNSEYINLEVSCCSNICVVYVENTKSGKHGAEIFKLEGNKDIRKFDKLMTEKISNAHKSMKIKNNEVNNTIKLDVYNELSEILKSGNSKYQIDFNLNNVMNLKIKRDNADGDSKTILDFIHSDLITTNSTFIFSCSNGLCDIELFTGNQTQSQHFIILPNENITKTIENSFSEKVKTNMQTTEHSQGSSEVPVSVENNNKNKYNSADDSKTSVASNSMSVINGDYRILKGSGGHSGGGGRSGGSSGSHGSSSSSGKGGSSSSSHGSSSSSSSGKGGSSSTSSSGKGGSSSSSSSGKGGSLLTKGNGGSSSSSSKGGSTLTSPGYSSSKGGSSLTSSGNKGSSASSAKGGSGLTTSAPRPALSSTPSRSSLSSHGSYTSPYSHSVSTNKYNSATSIPNYSTYHVSSRSVSPSYTKYSYSSSYHITNYHYNPSYSYHQYYYYNTYYFPYHYSHVTFYYYYAPDYYEDWYYGVYYYPYLYHYHNYYIIDYHFHYYRPVYYYYYHYRLLNDQEEKPVYEPSDWLPSYSKQMTIDETAEYINHNIDKIFIYIECFEHLCLTYAKMKNSGERIYIDVNMRKYAFLDNNLLTLEKKKCLIRHFLSSPTIHTAFSACSVESPFKIFPVKKKCANIFASHCQKFNFWETADRLIPNEVLQEQNEEKSKFACLAPLACLVENPTEENKFSCGESLYKIFFKKNNISVKGINYHCKISNLDNIESLDGKSTITKKNVKISTKAEVLSDEIEYINEHDMSSSDMIQYNQNSQKVTEALSDYMPTLIIDESSNTYEKDDSSEALLNVDNNIRESLGMESIINSSSLLRLPVVLTFFYFYLIIF